jgi:hypothetical protein
MIAGAYFLLYSKDPEADWAISTSVRLPSGSEIGLYEPIHPTMVKPHST